MIMSSFRTHAFSLRHSLLQHQKQGVVRQTSLYSSAPGDNKLGEVHSKTLAWVENYVIGLNLCPFAKVALTSGNLRVKVCPSDQPDDLKHMVLSACEELQKEGMGTVVVAAPYVKEVADFYDYLDLVGEINWEMKFEGHEGGIQLATFHPDYMFADAEADDVSNWTNRSPFPLFHLLREEDVEAAVKIYDGNTETIWLNNKETVRTLGESALASIVFSKSEER